MKLSSKARYGLACCLYLANHINFEKVSVNQLATDLSLSPLYLQQVMSALKVGNIVDSTKGSGGGYELIKAPDKITVFDCLIALDPSLFEATEQATQHHDFQTVLDENIFKPLNHHLKEFLSSITLDALNTKLKEHQSESLMFYI